MYLVSFNPALVEDHWQTYLDKFVECTFILDLCLNFLQSYINTETLKEHRDFKDIARNYIFNGWFIVDFFSVFPFEAFLPTGQVTKLMRLFRLPRLIKLFDISKFQKVVNSLTTSSTGSRDDKIIAQYQML